MAIPVKGFVEVPTHAARLWIRAGLEAFAPLLFEAWCGRAEAWVGGGRARHPVVDLPGEGRVVVRRYYRGGAVRFLNGDRYFRGDRAADEAAITEAAREAGVHVPEVVAFGRMRAGIGYRAMIATRLLVGARDAQEVLSAGRDGGMLSALGEQLALLHGAGIAHPDVNLRNVLVDRSRRVWLIDFDRARRYAGPVPRARRAAGLRRLGRSADKLGVGFSDADWAALRKGYGPDWPLE